MIESLARCNGSSKPEAHHRLMPSPHRAAAVLASPAALRQAFERECRYYLDEAMLDRVWLALRLGKPLLVEGEAGCGKTELARSLPRVLGRELLRITCHAHTDLGDLFFREDPAERASYLQQHPCRTLDDGGDALRPPNGLRPGLLWRAIQCPDPCVVLLDELDKAPVALDHALLEWLETFTITDSLLGAIEPVSRPYVVLTSNTTRPLAEQLRDRCVFLYFDGLTPEREAEIIRTKSGADPRLAAQIAYLCRAFREIGFKSPPSIREALDMSAACQVLGITRLDETSLAWLRNLAVKRQDDYRRAQKNRAVLFARAMEIAQEYAAPPAVRRPGDNGIPHGGQSNSSIENERLDTTGDGK